jgi:hypothetical protein
LHSWFTAVEQGSYENTEVQIVDRSAMVSIDLQIIERTGDHLLREYHSAEALVRVDEFVRHVSLCLASNIALYRGHARLSPICDYRFRLCRIPKFRSLSDTKPVVAFVARRSADDGTTVSRATGCLKTTTVPLAGSRCTRGFRRG